MSFLVYHPNLLKDPELGPIVQRAIQNGEGFLSQPMCEDCGGLKDQLKQASERNAELELQVIEYEKLLGEGTVLLVRRKVAAFMSGDRSAF